MADINGMGPRGRRGLKAAIAVALGATVGVGLGTVLIDVGVPTGPRMTFFDPWNAPSLGFGGLIGIVISKHITSPTRRTGAVALAVGVLAGAAAVLASLQPITTGWPVAAMPLLVIAGAGIVIGVATVLLARAARQSS